MIVKTTMLVVINEQCCIVPFRRSTQRIVDPLEQQIAILHRVGRERGRRRRMLILFSPCADREIARIDPAERRQLTVRSIVGKLLNRSKRQRIIESNIIKHQSWKNKRVSESEINAPKTRKTCWNIAKINFVRHV